MALPPNSPLLLIYYLVWICRRQRVPRYAVGRPRRWLDDVQLEVFHHEKRHLYLFSVHQRQYTKRNMSYEALMSSSSEFGLLRRFEAYLRVKHELESVDREIVVWTEATFRKRDLELQQMLELCEMPDWLETGLLGVRRRAHELATIALRGGFEQDHAELAFALECDDLEVDQETVRKLYHFGLVRVGNGKLSTMPPKERSERGENKTDGSDFELYTKLECIRAVRDRADVEEYTVGKELAARFGALDDVVLNVTLRGSRELTYALQAKQTLEGDPSKPDKVISSQELWRECGKKNYYVAKYFASYLKIKQHTRPDQLKEMIIWSTQSIADAALNNFEPYVTDEQEDILKPVLGSDVWRWKLDSSKMDHPDYGDLKQLLLDEVHPLRVVVDKFISVMFKKETWDSNKGARNYYRVMAQEVIDCDKKVFQDRFIRGDCSLDSNTLIFRRIFERAMALKIPKFSMHLLNSEEYKRYFVLQIDDQFREGNGQYAWKVESSASQADLEDFIARFVFYVNVPKVADFRNKLTQTLGANRFKELCDLVQQCTVEQMASKAEIDAIFELLVLRSKTNLKKDPGLEFEEDDGDLRSVLKDNNRVFIEAVQDIECSVNRVFMTEEFENGMQPCLAFRYRNFERSSECFKLGRNKLTLDPYFDSRLKELNNYFDSPIVLSDQAGMGKTTEMFYIADNIRNQRQDCLVVYLDCKAAVKLFREVDSLDAREKLIKVVCVTIQADADEYQTLMRRLDLVIEKIKTDGKAQEYASQLMRKEFPDDHVKMALSVYRGSTDHVRDLFEKNETYGLVRLNPSEAFCHETYLSYFLALHFTTHRAEPGEFKQYMKRYLCPNRVDVATKFMDFHLGNLMNNPDTIQLLKDKTNEFTHYLSKSCTETERFTLIRSSMNATAFNVFNILYASLTESDRRKLRFRFGGGTNQTENRHLINLKRLGGDQTLQLLGVLRRKHGTSFVVDILTNFSDDEEDFIGVACRKPFMQVLRWLFERVPELVVEERDALLEYVRKRVPGYLEVLIQHNNAEVLEEIIQWVKSNWSRDVLATWAENYELLLVFASNVGRKFAFTYITKRT
ncbi:hypothetical protein pipiens_014083 [Culex pipiens pipiens]|uniref:Uncharacterized protein n=1 Tax=Culex pipiens pipiens TaxID=38569 RepID=A0ABD1CW19_CULPP